MRIEIEIPKEFEEHFKQDKFENSFERIMADIKHSLENGDCLCAGRYEHETIEMLQKAFENSRQACDIDKVVAELEKIEQHCLDMSDWQGQSAICDAIEIVKLGGVTDDVCEWKKSKDYPFDWLVGCDGCEVNHRQGDYCPRCGKKIKAV